MFFNNFYNFICVFEMCFVFVLSITTKYDDIRFFGIYFERPFLSVFINYEEVTGMLVVSLRSINCRFWSNLGCLGWKVTILHVSVRVVHEEISKKSRDTNHTERYQGV